ncbi:hypothetical protein IE81DRAFT_183381 [Ceraceosorus guamensis]|uniref:Uncharacterized protein n=1 Tax=Ceraceosorus guamensis TaxID=1522189 RepID=A0A316VUP7_9BASI|nr:hypothetical protein IE81DRAFT_183381 [Ceraceosorus guamensis]PWN41170.1 hypothetical protein IE81DRAFT_183381 [Ceraceosorus guamensis]
MSSNVAVQPSQSDPSGADANQSGSKFKRFLKKFGRRTSDDVAGGHVEGSNVDTPNAQNGSPWATNGGEGLPNGHRSSGHTPSGAAPDPTVSDYKSNEKGTGRSRRGSAKAPTPILPPLSSNNDRAAVGQKSGVTPSSPAAALGLGFDASRAPDLAGTLQLPQNDGSNSPPPQIGGLPTLEALRPADVIASAPQSNNAGPAPAEVPQLREDAKPLEDLTTAGLADGPNTASAAAAAAIAPTEPLLTAETAYSGHIDGDGDEAPQSSGAIVSDEVLPAQAATTAASQDGSSSASGYEPSLGARTADTGKHSRASTKPTTLMSYEGRDGAAPSLAGIATHRHGDATSSAPGAASATPVISFVDPSISVPGADEPASSEPFISVPALSRPHPSNNPAPGAIPPDNASVLTLASSTAAASIGAGTGYAASSRHGHAHAPSLGGARSIVGSLMGERRNSSDTYASVKALPPQSRRGSDSSMRTGKESIPASATGLNSANAMLVGGAGSSAASFRDANTQSSPLVTASGGPGAPGDRISMQRTPSQRTIATQLSIPLSTSIGAGAGLAVPNASGSSSSNAASTATSGPTSPTTPQVTNNSASDGQAALESSDRAAAADGLSDGAPSALTAAAAAAAGAAGTIAATATSLISGGGSGSAPAEKDGAQVQTLPTAASTFAQENAQKEVQRTTEDANGVVQAHADSLAAQAS